MPFTLSHPAIVLPLGKSRFGFSLTALVAGSIAPDLEFFLQLREVENIGHHWYGIILFDLPVALLCCFLFHNLLKAGCIANLPGWYRNRFSPVLSFNWNRYAAANKGKVLISLVTGVLSHLFLDAFTHADGMFVLLLPVLHAEAGTGQVHLPVYFLLQVLFSIAGLLVVHQVIAALPVNQRSDDQPKQTAMYWPLLLGILLVILTIRLLMWPVFNSFWGIFMAFMGSSIYSWLLTAIILKKNNPS